MNDLETLKNLIEHEASNSKINDFFDGKLIESEDSEWGNINEAPVLLPGGRFGLTCFSRASQKYKGHYEVTEDALSSVPHKLSLDTKKSLLSVSRWPDLMYFSDHRCHAMTIHDDNFAAVNKKDAEDNSKKLLLLLTQEAKRFFKADKLEDFFFNLGNAVHLIQDIASHQGMTCLEHAYLDINNDSPDKNAYFIKLATQLTQIYLEELFSEELNSKKIAQFDKSIWWSKYFSVKSIIETLTGAWEYRNKTTNQAKKISHLSSGMKAKWFVYYQRSPQKLIEYLTQTFIPNKEL